MNRKIFKKVSCLFLLSLVLVVSGACSRKDILDEIPGVYYPLSCTSDDGEVFEIEDEELHIEKFGYGYFVFSGNVYELFWEYEDGAFRFEDSSEDVFTGTYEKGPIEGHYFNGYYYVFKKKK